MACSAQSIHSLELTGDTQTMIHWRVSSYKHNIVVVCLVFLFLVLFFNIIQFALVTPVRVTEHCIDFTYLKVHGLRCLKVKAGLVGHLNDDSGLRPSGDRSNLQTVGVAGK